MVRAGRVLSTSLSAVITPRPRSTRAGLVELRVDDTSSFAVGQELGVDIYAAGDKVDVTATSKGRGFAGAMERHNFKGQGASHGNHKHHRAPAR